MRSYREITVLEEDGYFIPKIPKMPIPPHEFSKSTVNVGSHIEVREWCATCGLMPDKCPGIKEVKHG